MAGKRRGRGKGRAKAGGKAITWPREGTQGFAKDMLAKFGGPRPLPQSVRHPRTGLTKRAKTT